LNFGKEDPQAHLEEILAHASTQKPGEDLVAIGGMHTSVGLVNVIAKIESGECVNPELNSIPEAWLNWPCVAYFYEDGLENHWQELLALGNIDNESIHLKVSFYDKLTKLRELFLATFTTVDKYRKLAKESKARSKEATQRIERFKTQACKALVLEVGQLGHMLSIVNHDDTIYNLYLRVIKRDVQQPQISKTKGKREIGRKNKAPMGSANELVPFLNLPPVKLQELLEGMVDGTLTPAMAKGIAELYNSKARCLRHIEAKFNEKFGQKNKTRAKGKGLWKDYKEIVEILPDVQRQLNTWQVPFSKARLNPIESKAFDAWVDKVYESYEEGKKGKRRSLLQPVPEQFVVGMVKEQKKDEKCAFKTRVQNKIR
jgi:hypothetical protein